ncbi:hypothetical protein BDV98DRAFT_577124, partial [Pterulicium gracile]
IVQYSPHLPARHVTVSLCAKSPFCVSLFLGAATIVHHCSQSHWINGLWTREPAMGLFLSGRKLQNALHCTMRHRDCKRATGLVTIEDESASQATVTVAIVAASPLESIKPLRGFLCASQNTVATPLLNQRTSRIFFFVLSAYPMNTMLLTPCASSPFEFSVTTPTVLPFYSHTKRVQVRICRRADRSWTNFTQVINEHELSTTYNFTRPRSILLELYVVIQSFHASEVDLIHEEFHKGLEKISNLFLSQSQLQPCSFSCTFPITEAIIVQTDPSARKMSISGLSLNEKVREWAKKCGAVLTEGELEGRGGVAFLKSAAPGLTRSGSMGTGKSKRMGYIASGLGTPRGT